MGSEPAPVVDVWVFPPHPGERFVICSDGLSNELSADRIREIVAAQEDPQACAEALVAAGVESGGRDNVSVIVVALDSGDEELDDIDTAPRGSAAASGGPG